MRLTGRVILPERMQRVQALTVHSAPFTSALIDFKFGSQRVRVLMFECETLLPERGPLPQKSQMRAMRVT